MSDDDLKTTHMDSSEWEQRWERQAGFSQRAMRPGEYRDKSLFRLAMIAALLFVIAAGTVTIAVVEVMNRHDAKEAAKAISSELEKSSGSAAASSFDDYDACMDDPDTTSEECEAAFPT